MTRDQIEVGELVVDVVRKEIKNVHLSVHPPTGRVTIAAPTHLNLDTVRVFAIAKLPWIRQQQKKLLQQERETVREYLDRESHYVWGERYLMKVVERDAPPAISLTPNQILFQTRPDVSQERKQEMMDGWYRGLIRDALPDLLSAWEPIVGVKPHRIHVQRMKTKWGSCNPATGAIRLNTDLAKKPRDCLEYILVHELVHLLEPTHNARFVALMDQFMPKWKSHRDLVNLLPVRHEDWGY